jgi:hypothetical protein
VNANARYNTVLAKLQSVITLWYRTMFSCVLYVWAGDCRPRSLHWGLLESLLGTQIGVVEAYIADQADQALEALVSDKPLLERLAAAHSHFQLVSGDEGFFLDSAPENVRDAIQTFVLLDVAKHTAEAARACKDAIAVVLEQRARTS